MIRLILFVTCVSISCFVPGSAESTVQIQTNVTATTNLPQQQTNVTATTNLPQQQTNVTATTNLPQQQTNVTATTNLPQQQTNVTATTNLQLNNTNITNIIGTLLGNLTKTNFSKSIENLLAELNNKDVTKVLGNATDLLGKLLGNGNESGMAGLFKAIEGFLGNGDTMAGISKTIGELIGNGNGITGIAEQIGKLLGNGNGMAGIAEMLGKLLDNGNGMAGIAETLGKLLDNGNGKAGISETIGKILGNGNGLGNIANIINGLMGVANGSDTAKTIEGLLGGINGSSPSKTSPLDALQSVPAISTLTKLLPVVLEYLTAGFKSLQERNVSESCMADLYMWKDGLQSYQGWAWKLIDAGFRLPSNLAGFNIISMGDMTECLSIHAKSFNKYTRQMQDFDGKYCRLLFPLTLPQVGSKSAVLGACASSHCSNTDVKVIVDTAMEAILPQVPIETVASCIEDKTLDSKSIAVICFLAILGSVVVAATAYDVIVFQLKSRDDDSKSYNLHDAPIQMTNIHTNGSYIVTEVENGPLPEKRNIGTSNTNGVVHNADQNLTKPKSQSRGRLVKAVLAFSAYSNARKLLGTSQASGSLSAINGIRFLSMAWVILGHTYYFANNYTANMYDFGKKKLNQYLFSAIINATPSVDSFFALSGCLVAYLTLREIKKVGGVLKLNWGMFYFHRFWRLTPPYMLIILVGTLLYRYIGNGALQTGEDSPYMHQCRDNWWVNLLYVNNFVKIDESCMGWSWYLANDMQMYVLSPLILIPFFYNKIIGGIVSGVFLLATIITTSVITNDHEYSVQQFSQYAPTRDDGHYGELMYIPVYTRIGPYIVGLITGYILYKCECKCKIPKWVNCCCWLLCLLVSTLVIYGPYTYEDQHIMSTNESTAFYTLFRTGWGMAVCWVIFACATGNGGFINDVLSWSPYIPLGRLTYCAYLLHPLVMSKYYESRMHPLYLTDYNTVYFFIGNLVLSYGAAFVTSLFFESPMMGLEKAIFNK